MIPDAFENKPGTQIGNDGPVATGCMTVKSFTEPAQVFPVKPRFLPVGGKIRQPWHQRFLDPSPAESPCAFIPWLLDLDYPAWVVGVPVAAPVGPRPQQEVRRKDKTIPIPGTQDTSSGDKIPAGKIRKEVAHAVAGRKDILADIQYPKVCPHGFAVPAISLMRLRQAYQFLRQGRMIILPFSVYSGGTAPPALT